MVKYLESKRESSKVAVAIRGIQRIILLAFVVPVVAFGAIAQNPRAGGSRVIQRGNTAADGNASLRRSATSVISRSAARRSKNIDVVHHVVARTASNVSARSGTRSVSTANVSRATVASKTGKVRSAVNKNIKPNNVSRAATARATAVFNDVSKIGGGYSNCRDAYATCMDQFCANANATYRRCFCSDRFLKFKDVSDNLNTALSMLSDFKWNNLNVVNKTAAEVTAMYTATAGEEAMAIDTSESQRKLDEIGEILSGNKSSSNSTSLSSLGIIDFGDFSDIGDIWNDKGTSSSIFSRRKVEDISGLEGAALYQRASSQCASVTRNNCQSDVMFNLASSAYSILVTQDCNVFEKDINIKKEQVTQSIRDAEKALRNARLDEYRARNSDDVNECLAKVEESIMQICGSGYEKCLDPTGKYINRQTGEPKYDELFNIRSIAPNLVDSGDILTANAAWNSELDSYKIYAETALNNCVDLSDVVWREFKRMALIKIAQAQDDKVQQAKDECISVIKDCYDYQTGELTDFADTGDARLNVNAVGRVTARSVCYEKVMQCAALYGDPDGCVYDRTTRKISASGVSGKKCGLQTLLTFVDSVDSAKVAKACEEALDEYAHERCQPKTTYKQWPNGVDMVDTLTGEKIVSEYPDGCMYESKKLLRNDLTQHARTVCALDMIKNDESNTIGDSSAFNTDIVERVIKNIFDSLNLSFSMGCEDEDVGGVWLDTIELTVAVLEGLTVSDLNEQFYNKYYGGTSLTSILASVKQGDIGACVKTTQQLCLAIGGTKTDTGCDVNSLLPERCEWLDGIWDYTNQVCTIP